MVEYLNKVRVSKSYPYILTLGNNCQHATQVFVIINGLALGLETLLQAVDVCVKAFLVFDIEYPQQSERVWEFLHTCIYEIPGLQSKIVTFLQMKLLACR